MLVNQEPADNGLYFQKAIPDIILEKNGADTSVLFELKKGADVILLEKYVYDVANIIRIRNIGEVVEKYLSIENLMLGFSYTITDGATVHTRAFTAMKCDAEISVDANTWTAKNFLTRCPDKRTTKSRNEYLSFLQKLSYGAVTVNFQLFYVIDGQYGSMTNVLPVIAASAGDVVTTFNASAMAVLNVTGLPTNTELLRYDIWLTGTGLETYRYTFMVDNMLYRYRQNFVFVNCFGVLETFTATGISDNKKTAEYNLGNIENHYRKISQDFISEKKLNSGFLSSYEMEWIDDLLRSYDVATYIPGSTGANTQVTLTEVDKTDTDANELQAFTFSYRNSKNNHTVFLELARGIFDFTFDNTFN